MTTTELKVLLTDAISAAINAGEEIMKVYAGDDMEEELKSDNTPLTIADRRSHESIAEALEGTGIPLLSEEGKEIAYSDREHWKQLWVVDPLDGTKEFIKQNGEFTVNIALVEDQVPVLGVIYVPVQEVLYFGAEVIGAYRMDNALHHPESIWGSLTDILEKSQSLPLKKDTDRPFTMVGSRSHMSTETADFFEDIRKEYPNAVVLSRGSSLKICMVAEGSADVYPRFAPTMEWDTAAGHALVRQTGFEIYEPHQNKPLIYNKEDLLNPWFIVKKRKGEE